MCIRDRVVTAETGVSTSTIRRMASAEDAEADGVLTLVAWLGLQPEAFMDGVSSDRAVAPLGSMVVRVDMASVRRTNPSISWKGSRTTIQRLAAAARAAGVTVESLTRRSAT